MNDFFANPGSILGFSVPFGTWFGARVRLHFWMLLAILFIYVDGVRYHDLTLATIAAALAVLAVLCHEFGHRIAASLVGGSHDEFVLWPIGGMIPPNAPNRPLAKLVAHGGGIVVNLLLAGAAAAVLAPLHQIPNSVLYNPILLVFGNIMAFAAGDTRWLQALHMFLGINLWIAAVNTLIVVYWFDGAYLLEALLTPLLGLYNAINITCILGMIESVVLFFLSLWATSFIGMVVTVLMFSGSFIKRRELKAAGPMELQDGIDLSAAYDNRPVPRKKMHKSWFKAARRRAQQEQAEQARIDSILAKVHDHGLHSLTWFEKRVLKKATARQRERERDLAER